VRDGALAVKKSAAVGKRIGSDVEYPHDRDTRQIERATATIENHGDSEK
jgi:hypothetical protein